MSFITLWKKKRAANRAGRVQSLPQTVRLELAYALQGPIANGCYMLIGAKVGFIASAAETYTCPRR